MEYFLAAAISIAVIIIAYFLHIILLKKSLQNSKKIQDIDASENKSREDIALGKARNVYFVAWLILCLSCAIFEICFGKEVGEKIRYFVLSVLILFGGIGGIITKSGGLKSINPNSKLYFYFINPLLIVIAVFTIIHHI